MVKLFSYLLSLSFIQSIELILWIEIVTTILVLKIRWFVKVLNDHKNDNFQQ